MARPRRMWIAVAALASALSPAAAVAQESPPERAAEPDHPDPVLRPVGYVQLDLRAFPGWGESPDDGNWHRGHGEIRRLRLGLEGRWRRFAWEFSGEPIEGAEFLKDAYLDVRLPGSWRLRGGHFKLPGSREVLISARKLDFVERTAFASSIGTSRDLGVMLTGAVRPFSYRAGVFSGDASSRDSRAGMTGAARAGWRPAKPVEVALSMTRGRLRADGKKHGFEGSAASGYEFFDALYVQGRRTRVGVDVEWAPGSWELVAETLRARDERLGQGALGEDLPALVAQGWSASVVRRFGGKTAPNRQWQIGGRYERLGFDDAAAPTGVDSTKARAPDVRPRAVHTLTAAGLWKSSSWLRVLANAGLERYTDLRSAPQPGRPNYFTFVLRFQVETP